MVWFSNLRTSMLYALVGISMGEKVCELNRWLTFWWSHCGAVCGIVHDDVIKWKHFPRYWPFVGGIHRSPVNSPYKGQWRGALMFSMIYALNKRLSKQWWGWWFETPTRPLWRHYNDHIRPHYGGTRLRYSTHQQIQQHMGWNYPKKPCRCWKCFQRRWQASSFHLNLIS